MSKQRVNDSSHQRFQQIGTLTMTTQVPGTTPSLSMHTIKFDDGKEEQFLSYQIDVVDAKDELEYEVHRTHCFREVDGNFEGCKYGSDQECPHYEVWKQEFLGNVFYFWTEKGGVERLIGFSDEALDIADSHLADCYFAMKNTKLVFDSTLKMTMEQYEF